MVVCCGNVSSYRQDSAWSWFICLCSATCMILSVGLAFALGVLFPVIMDSFNESRERTGTLKHMSTLRRQLLQTHCSQILPSYSQFVAETCSCKKVHEHTQIVLGTSGRFNIPR